LREGEFVADVADALGVSRETIRRFRDEAVAVPCPDPGVGLPRTMP
jgi:hypothetical protein